MFPSIAWAQVLVSETDFSGLKSASDDPVALGTTLPDYPDWEFMRCYKIKAGGLFVGDSNNPGSFTSAPLGIEGNANIILEVKRSSSGNATIEATLSGGGTLSSVVSKTIDKSSYYHIVYYVKDGTPSTRLTITGTAGKFYVNNMRVYNIGDVVFYESFDYMNNPYGADVFRYRDLASIGDCDNSEVTELNEIYQATGNIYFCYSSESRKSAYKILRLPVEDNSDVLLSFKVSRYGGSADGKVSFSCSDDTQISAFNIQGVYSEKIEENTRFLECDFSESFKWYDCKVGLNGICSSTELTIKGYIVNLDEVLVRPACILDEKENNDNKVSALSTVLLIRTLTPNIWCPLCLPFDVTQSQMEVATGTTCELRTLSDVIDGVFMFNKTTSVSAGTPFLVKVNTEVENPVFTGVTIVDTSADIATGSTAGYSFVGTYSPVPLNTDGTHLFLDKEGNLCQPGTEAGYNRLNGLRAYFVVPSNTSEARVFISDTSAEVSRISNTSTARHNTYDLYGRQIDASYSKGLHIRNGRKYLIP